MTEELHPGLIELKEKLKRVSDERRAEVKSIMNQVQKQADSDRNKKLGGGE